MNRACEDGAVKGHHGNCVSKDSNAGNSVEPLTTKKHKGVLGLNRQPHEAWWCTLGGQRQVDSESEVSQVYRMSSRLTMAA